MRTPSPFQPRSIAAWLARDAWLNLALLTLSCGLLLVFLVARDLPLVDLPQHAAQIATWQRWDAGVPAVVQRFELNFRTPYLLAYPIARALAPFVGAVLALKLVVWLAIVANAFALKGLARRLGHEPWLAVFGIVTALGPCFYWGFVSFMLAIPLAIGSLTLALDHAERPSYRRASLLAAALCLLLSAHGVAFMMGYGCVALLLVRGNGSRSLRWAPLAAPMALIVVWLLPGRVAERIGGDSWDVSWVRLYDFPALLVGMGAYDRFALWLGMAILVVTAAALGLRFTRAPARVLPLVFLLLAYGSFPAMFRGIFLLHTRLPCFLVPLWLLAIEPARLASAAHTFRVRVAIAGTTLVCLAGFGSRLVEFNRESADYHALAARLPPELRMRPLVFNRDSFAFPGVPAFLHFSAYYYVEKGGTQGYSFAMYPISVVRLRPGIEATMRYAAEWRPDRFRESEIDDYDYFLVRSAYDRGPEIFGDAPVVLQAHEGLWWGYSKLAPPAALATRGTP